MAEFSTQSPEEDTTVSVHGLNWDMFTVISLSICIGIVMIFAIFGNCLVILVIMKHKGMRTRTNLFLCSLAVADLLTGIILMPSTLTTVAYRDWVLGEAVCQFTGFMMPLLFISAIHTLMYMAVHKYLTIIHPFEDYMTKKKTFLMIGAAWLWALFIGLCTVFGFNSVSYKPNTTQCGPDYPDGGHPKRYIFAGIVIISCYLIPLIVIVFCYVKMFKEIKRYTHRIVETTTWEEEEAFSQQRRITITLFVVLIFFVIGWTPYISYTIYATIISDKSKIPSLYNGVSYWFGYLNSAVNPVIYAFRSKAFRDGYKSIFWRRRPKVKDDSLKSHASGRLSRAGDHLKEVIRKRFQSLVPSSNNTSQAGSNTTLAGSSGSTPMPRRRGISIASLPGNFKFDAAAKGVKLSEIVHQIMDRHHRRLSQEQKMKAEPESFTLPSEDDSDEEYNGHVLNGDIGSKTTSPNARTIYPAPRKFTPQRIRRADYDKDRSKVTKPIHKSEIPQTKDTDIQIVISEPREEEKDEETKPVIHYKPHTVPDGLVYLHGVIDEPPEPWSGLKPAEDTSGKRKHVSMSDMPEKSEMPGKEKRRELQRSVSAKPRRGRLPSIEKLDINFDFRERSKTFDAMSKPKKPKFRMKLRRSFKVFGSQKKKKKKAPDPFVSLENLSKDLEVGEVFVNPKEFHSLSHSYSNPDISINRMVNVFQERQNAKKLYRKSMKRKNYSSGTEEKTPEVSVLPYSATDDELDRGIEEAKPNMNDGENTDVIFDIGSENVDGPETRL